MKKYYPLAMIVAIVIASCSSSQVTTYRPRGSTEGTWEINVVHKSGVMQNFKVIINDSTVIDDDADFLSGAAEAKSTYRGREIKLTVTYSKGFLGAEEKYTAVVLVDNDLAGKCDFLFDG